MFATFFQFVKIFGFLERYLSEKYKTNSKLLVVFCTQKLAGVKSSDN